MIYDKELLMVLWRRANPKYAVWASGLETQEIGKPIVRIRSEDHLLENSFLLREISVLFYLSLQLLG